MKTTKKVLILTASFGDGHNAASRSLRDAIELINLWPWTPGGPFTFVSIPVSFS